MKLYWLIAILIILSSCFSKKKIDENLPKDIALKPQTTSPVSNDSINTPLKDIDTLSIVKEAVATRSDLEKLRFEIIKLSKSEICNDASKWRTSPIGAKPCGGPTEYIAYPKSSESKILKMIQQYTKAESEFNKRNNLVSDCRIVLPPTEIICENGEAKLLQEHDHKQH